MLVSRAHDNKSFGNSFPKRGIYFGKFFVILQRQLINSQKSKVESQKLQWLQSLSAVQQEVKIYRNYEERKCVMQCE